MRIISGNFKGSNLYLPNNENIRPLKDMVRESIFNLLIHSNKILLKLEQCNVLDLYSGTGSFGLECLSREAKYVLFVENEKLALEILKKNINKFKIEKKTKILFHDVLDLIKKRDLKLKFDIIFCDPPFKDKNVYKLIESIFSKNLLNKKGILILHRNKNNQDKLPDYFKILEERNYGLSKIYFGNFLS